MALGLALSAGPVLAQDVFSLPAGTASPSSRPAGPVDPENPVVAARPRPVQSATPQPSAAPSAEPTAAATRAAGPARPVVRPAPAARPAQNVIATQAALPPADPLTLPGAVNQPAAAALPTTLPTDAPAPVTAAPATTPATSSDRLTFAVGALVGALVLLALLGGAIWRRRKPEAALTPDFEPPVVPADRPAPQPAPSPAQPAAPATAPEPAPAPLPEGLQITLEARRLDASLVATTLAYQLRLTNHGEAPLSALAIEGDMVSAHASLPVERQIASADQQLEQRHALVALAPGESADFKGELRLPLSAITPIRSGNAAYFVPLARLRVAAAQGADESLVIAQTFVIGELPEQPGGALRPFRLDLGPRTFGKVGQRAVG